MPATRAATREELFRRVARGREFLHAEGLGRVRLADVARAACLSPFHFHRAFRQAFGKTPSRYVQELRLARAAQLLANGVSVTETCFQVGFESVGSFSTLFYRYFGAPPSSRRLPPGTTIGMKQCWLFGSLTVVLALLTSPSQAADKRTRNETFRLSRVSYIMLGVTNLQASCRFYRDRLGLAVTRQTDDVMFVAAGSLSLVLSTEVKKDPGATEVVFAVDHVQQAYQALRQAGVTFNHQPRPLTESSWVANFQYPDGHILSLFGPR